MPIILDFSRLPQILHDHAINLITAFRFLVHDQETNSISLSPDEDILKRLMEDRLICPMWLSFGAAVECLAKAVLLSHEIPFIRKAKLENKLRGVLIQDAGNYNDARHVFDLISDIRLEPTSDSWIDRELVSRKISLVYDCDTGTLLYAFTSLHKLVDKAVLTQREFNELMNAVQVFALVRRNLHAHTHHGLNVAKSFNYDLENLYIPMTNTLLRLFRKPNASPPE